MAKAKRKAQSKRPTSTGAIGIKATREWIEWLEELAKHYRTTVSGVVDRALTEWTEAEEYPKRPPSRTP
jgi:hypothetical protein